MCVSKTGPQSSLKCSAMAGRSNSSGANDWRRQCPEKQVVSRSPLPGAPQHQTRRGDTCPPPTVKSRGSLSAPPPSVKFPRSPNGPRGCPRKAVSLSPDVKVVAVNSDHPSSSTSSSTSSSPPPAWRATSLLCHTMKPSTRFTLRPVPLLFVTLLLAPLPLLLPNPHRTFALTNIRPLSPPSCLFLQVSHDTPPPNLPAPSICCVVLLPSTAPSAFANASTSSTHCHHVRLPPSGPSPAARLAVSFPLLSARFDFSWLLLPPAPDIFVCHAALASRLADVDPAALIRAGLPTSRAPVAPKVVKSEHALPDILHATDVAFEFRDHLSVLSTATVDALAKRELRVQRHTTQAAMLDAWLMGIPVRPLVVSAAQFDDVAEGEACQVPSSAAVVTGVPSANRSSCITGIDRRCDLIPPVPASVRDVSFLVLPQGVRGDVKPTEIYLSIRSAFPFNEVIFADLSPDGVVARQLRTVGKGDAALQVKRFHPVFDAHVRNEMVSAASSRFVCFATDVQRLSWEARVGVMLKEVASGDADIAGGYLLRGTENAYKGRLGPELLVTETTVGYRYGFTDEMTLRREGASVSQLAGRDCFRAHRTSDFMLAQRETLMRHQWRPQFGSLAHDEFFVRVMRKELKVAICNSAVRHRYYAPPTQRDRRPTDWFLLRGEAKRLCLAWDEELGDIGALAMRGLEFDCAKKRVCERTETKGGDGTQFEKEWTCQSWDD